MGSKTHTRMGVALARTPALRLVVVVPLPRYWPATRFSSMYLPKSIVLSALTQLLASWLCYVGI